MLNIHTCRQSMHTIKMNKEKKTTVFSVSPASLHAHTMRPQEQMALRMKPGAWKDGTLPNRMVEILLWAYMVKPSLSQNSPQLALVTRFPNQLWEISWMMTSAKERSPASRHGVTKVRQGFSIPPNGKDGGIKSKSYLPRN